MKLSIVLLLLLVACNKEKDPFPSKIELQRDIFIQENGCSDERISTHNVISLNVTLPESMVKTGMAFDVKDKISGNSEKIFFGKDHYLYANHHKEYNLPHCEKEKCELELYIFTNDWKKIGTSFEITLTGTLGGDQIFSKEFQKIENTFSTFETMTLPEIKFFKNAGNYTLMIEKAELQKIKDINVSEIEAVVLWRNKDDILYREKSNVYHLKDQSVIKMDHVIEKPTYLAAMVMYKKDHHVLEIKREIMNNNDAYYNCKK